MELTQKAFIPFRNQNNRVALIAREDPVYLSILNDHIRDFEPSLAFDPEDALAKQNTKYVDQYLASKTPASWDDLYAVWRKIIATYAPYRLVNYKPLRVMVVNGTVGVECEYSGAMDAEQYLPKDVQMCLAIYGLDEVRKNKRQRAALMYSGAIFAFVVDPPF